ncbi:hypothetical protein [Calothrix rhizosoleniae]|uniref:hypothetical protein n=1 Tax=Calothrix rhizosoleniae TaxID=888997 RepID=UPI000B4A334E|nr:hypothetical protein [Calothrix rhizosoleniae]
MQHPLQKISSDNYLSIFFPLLLLTTILAIVMSVIPLQPDIMSFTVNSLKVVKYWDEAAKIRAAFVMGLDFLYLTVYSTTLSLACIGAIRVFETVHSSWKSIGMAIAWSQWLAAFLDIIENIALTNILFNNVNQILPQIAKWCTTLKLILIILGLTYIVMAGVAGMRYFGSRKNYF